MKGDYRFLRTKAGKPYFARVAVEVLANDHGFTIEDALPDSANVDAGEMNRRTAATWVDAAELGIRDAVDHTRAAGLWTAGCRVRLTALIGSFVDTRQDVVQCAAALATWQALAAPEPGPAIDFDGGMWKLLFPAHVRTAQPGQPS